MRTLAAAVVLTTTAASGCDDKRRFGCNDCIVSVSAGGSHACALDTTGGVWCWGYNAAGQLGVGTTTDSSVPVKVEGLEGMAQVQAGHSHTCALKKDGTVWCWGRNTDGQLGIGTNPGPESCPEIADPDDGCSTTPVQVLNLEGVVSISTGQLHACALKPDRTVWCWGDNQIGQLGDGTRTTRHFAVRVQGLNDATAVSAGLFHSCALGGEGTAWCWGANQFGQIGDGTTEERHTPVRVQGLPEAVSVVAGPERTCALTVGGKLWCWGSNNWGLLGIGTEEGPDTCHHFDDFSCSKVPVRVQF